MSRQASVTVLSWRLRFFLLALLLIAASCSGRRAARTRELAFVAAELSNAVLVIDLDRLAVIASIPVSRAPIAVQAAPSGNEVYVATRAGRLEVIDAARFTVAASIAVSGSPLRLKLAPDGHTAFVLSRVEPAVHLVDLRRRRVLRSIPLHRASDPVAIEFVPQAGVLCVADAAGRAIQIVELGRQAPTRSERSGLPAAVALPGAPVSLAVLRDASQIFAAVPGADQVSAVDLKLRRVLAHLPAGARPSHLALKPDGGEMLAVNTGSNSLTIITSYTDEVAMTMPVGNAPVEALVTRDSARAYVANSASDNITVVDIENRKVVAAVPAGSGPFRLALTPDERFLLVLNARSHDMAVIRADANPISLVTMLPVGMAPSDIAVKVVR